MKETIKEHNINRVVVSSCTPKTHEPIFMDTLESVGLNKYLFEMANIRNQDSWVHGQSGNGNGKSQGTGAHGRGAGRLPAPPA
jgi:heterodisulfide reductase subunit A-like polyferredoxin